MCCGVEVVVWASAGATPESRRAMIMQLVRFFLAMRNSSLDCPELVD
jgi:hypothetical protein